MFVTEPSFQLEGERAGQSYDSTDPLHYARHVSDSCDEKLTTSSHEFQPQNTECDTSKTGPTSTDMSLHVQGECLS